jgi:hypothetical protein
MSSYDYSRVRYFSMRECLSSLKDMLEKLTV